MDTPSKSIFKSRTFWLAAAGFAASLIGFLEGKEFIQANPSAVTVLGMLAAALAVYLRTDTEDPVHIVGK